MCIRGGCHSVHAPAAACFTGGCRGQNATLNGLSFAPGSGHFQASFHLQTAHAGNQAPGADCIESAWMGSLGQVLQPLGYREGTPACIPHTRTAIGAPPAASPIALDTAPLSPGAC